MFVYLHFNVPSIGITDLVRNVSMKRFSDVERSPLSMFFSFYQIGLCSLSYIAYEYSIYHFCVMIKYFPRVIIIQDFKL